MKKITKKATAPKKTKKVEVTKFGDKMGDKEIPISDNPEIQDGVPSSNLKNNPPKGYATIGLSKGITLNMGDYQSARIDVFIQRNVPDTDEAIKAGLDDINEKLTEEIVRQSEELDDM